MAGMLDVLRSLLTGATAAAQAPAAAGDARMRAVAALLVEVARADGDYAPEERAAIDRFLAHMFGLDQGAARAARAAGEAAQAGAADLVRFTRVIKTGLDAAERVTLLEALWSVALSDGARDPHEDALLRRLAPLIAVTDRDSAEARRRVAARLGLDG